eukprot:496136-Prorocentrum_minimum.AAC.1
MPVPMPLPMKVPMSSTAAMAACMVPCCERGSSPAKMADTTVFHPMPRGTIGNAASCAREAPAKGSGGGQEG